MKLKIAVLAIALMMGSAACSETTPNPGTSAVGPAPQATLQERMSDQARVAPPTAVASAPATLAPTVPAATAPPVAATTDFPTIPDGAQFTLMCMHINSPSHVQEANQLRASLVRKTQSQDWYVVHAVDESVLYYGFYKTFDDPHQAQEKQRAQNDKKTVAALRDLNGDTPFEACAFEALPSADPPAPPEWDLKNAKGYWALQIDAYRGAPERKQYAVDVVKAARAKGINAFYYHGPSISSVVIGTWPREALKEQDRSDVRSADAGSAVMVIPQPLEKGKLTDDVHLPDGTKAKVMVPRVEIQDPTLLAAMEEYPYSAVNGFNVSHSIRTKSGATVEQLDPSFLVKLPHADDDDAAVTSGDNAPTTPHQGPAMGAASDGLPPGFPRITPAQ